MSYTHKTALVDGIEDSGYRLTLLRASTYLKNKPGSGFPAGIAQCQIIIAKFLFAFLKHDTSILQDQDLSNLFKESELVAYYELENETDKLTVALQALLRYLKNIPAVKSGKTARAYDRAEGLLNSLTREDSSFVLQTLVLWLGSQPWPEQWLPSTDDFMAETNAATATVEQPLKSQPLADWLRQSSSSEEDSGPVDEKLDSVQPFVFFSSSLTPFTPKYYTQVVNEYLLPRRLSPTSPETRSIRTVRRHYTKGRPREWWLKKTPEQSELWQPRRQSIAMMEMLAKQIRKTKEKRCTLSDIATILDSMVESGIDPPRIREMYMKSRDELITAMFANKLQNGA